MNTPNNLKHGGIGVKPFDDNLPAPTSDPDRDETYQEQIRGRERFGSMFRKNGESPVMSHFSQAGSGK